MPRIPFVDVATAPEPAKEILGVVERHTGHVPNALRILATSPAALRAWWDFERALARGSLPGAVREQVAILIAGTNRCGYCSETHSAAAAALGVSAADIEAARTGQASDPFARAVLAFASAAHETVGGVDDATIDGARAAGLTDAQLLEILAVLAVNTFNNAYNRLAGTPADEPVDHLLGDRSTAPPGRRPLDR